MGREVRRLRHVGVREPAVKGRRGEGAARQGRPSGDLSRYA